MEDIEMLELALRWQQRYESLRRAVGYLLGYAGAATLFLLWVVSR
jgi:hypothetical protein